MEIATRRFLLRDFVESDRAGFLAYQTAPRNLTFYGPDESSQDHAVRLFERFRSWASEHPRLNYQLAIVQREHPAPLVGCCGLRGEGLAADEAELGIELAPDCWGRYAYAVEVGRAVLDFGFGDLGLTAISGPTVSANERIGRLAEWFGAEVVAKRPGPPWMQARGWSIVDWRITRDRWVNRTTV